VLKKSIKGNIMIQVNSTFLLHTFSLLVILVQISFTQLISLKSVPVATGDQFLFHPSQRVGMGSVSIAIDDELADPFVNPARGGNLNQTWLFASPTLYFVTNNDGAGRTIPIGGLYANKNWYGGLLLSAQQLGGVRDDNSPLVSNNSSSNIYLHSYWGKKFSSEAFSLAASFFVADLGAVDGVDLLYGNSKNIEQFGNILDFRLGLSAELKTKTNFEAVLLFNHLNMTHLVKSNFWEPRLDFFDTPNLIDEQHLDRTDSYGLHFAYQEPIGQGGWKAGAILTFNYKTHPKIPNYRLMNIPRDPGNSWAYNFGLGISNETDWSLFGLDFIYEPIWSDTWADAAMPIETVIGDIIPTGGKTVDNNFRFSNYLLKIGYQKIKGNLGLHCGLQLRSIRYQLTQKNYVENFIRKQHEQWEEWTPSWGISLTLPAFRLSYMGRFTTGTGRPGIASTGWWRSEMNFAAGDNFIIAPQGDLVLEKSLVFTNQLVISIPIR
jgi:hypothetical protein